jgi:hypothetical protein
MDLSHSFRGNANIGSIFSFIIGDFLIFRASFDGREFNIMLLFN